ncbi:ABC transporter permease [Methylobacter sp.]|uniref:ABC transporter permease n=1 Tax=Methylobacter sp. TaxID=2051955 RepID=UPI003DA4E1C2
MEFDIISGINQFFTGKPSLSYIPFSACIIIGLAVSYYQVNKRIRQQSETDNVGINTSAKPKLIIEAGRTERQYWNDLWRYRELFYFLAWRDILVRYKQTVIGVAWALLRPLLTMIVFSVIFGKLAKLPSNGVPYPILVFAAMLPWQFFANALSECSNSLISNANLVSKVYFPRLIVPTSAVVVSFIDFLISSSILVALMIWYQFVPTWGMLMLPFLILLAFAAALGGGLWFAALNIKYRDFRYIVPFVVQFGLYVSPVGFSSDIVPEQWRLLYSLNPMVGVIDGFRWAILGQNTAIFWPGFLLSVGIVVSLLASGIWYFRKTERTFADII